MRSFPLRKLILSALLAALTCIATMIIQIPTAMQGYIHLGDAFVLLCGWILGPAYGFCAGALGSALADVLTGYLQYAPGTFLIKGLMTLGASLLYRLLLKILRQKRFPALLLSSIAGECIMILGYFAYDCILYGGPAAAIVSIPASLMQALGGVLFGVLLGFFLLRITPLKKYLE